MKLKELQIFGFKSFVDKINIEFGKGITIVVGPNGSGKSNVFDALRWVLGEQSAKSLRGGKMEDIIFSGSETRKAMGMAEVSIVMDNHDKSMAVPYEEVKITRRLYRSGESEYMINDNPVRLKDIVEMLMDTGVGIDSYSIIGQGEVDRIIMAKPVERREIFEEAAGITKYIKKRDEALRRLESTEQNMLRIHDIFEEVKRQTAQLEKQAKKAEKYKELRQQTNEYELKMYYKEIKDKSAGLNDFRSKKTGIDSRIHEEDEKLRFFEQDFERMRAEAGGKEAAVSSLREKMLLNEQEVKRLEDSAMYQAQRREELSARAEALKNENVENVGRLEKIKIEIEQVKKDAREKEAQIRSMAEGAQALEAEFTALLTAQEERKHSRDAMRRESDSVREEAAGLKSRLAGFEMAVKNADEQLASVEAEIRLVEEKMRSVNLEIERMTGSVEVKQSEIKNIKDREEQLIKEKIRKKGELDRLDSIISDMTMSSGKMQSKYNVLKEMHEKMAGYGELVRKVLTEYKSQLDDAERGDVVDTVGNLAVVEKNYEAAVEKSFKDSLQAVLVKNSKYVFEILSMYENEKGGITILNPSSVKRAPLDLLARWKSMVKHQAVTAYLPDVVGAGEGNELIKLLFYNVFVTENISSAMAVLEEAQCDEPYWLLTAKGEMVSNFGVFKKGETGEGQATGFLSREREINELNNEILMIKEKMLSVQEERGLHDAKIQEIEREIESLSQMYHSQFVEVVKDNERLSQRAAEKEAGAAGAARLATQKNALEASRSQAAASKDELEARIREKEARASELAAQTEAAEQEMSQKEDEIAAKKAAIEAKKIEAINTANSLQMINGNAAMQESRAAEINTRYNAVTLEINDLAAKIAACEEEKKSIEAKVLDYKNSAAGQLAELESLRKSYDEFRSRMDSAGGHIREMGKTRETLKEEEYELRVKISEFEHDIKSIHQKILEEFKMTPDENTVNAGAAGEEEYTTLSLQVSENREKMDKLGVINLVAIEEYNELKKRYEFLDNQYKDLNVARENLKKVIKKTNEESMEMFSKAFEEIKVRFREVFKKIMKGGEADLILIDQENMLESGIDIIAKPPGKKLQTISLLSGGEKALTAIALLFSIFLVKASPFCFMDEIDAPLDDVNIARFTNILKEFKDRTQFIIISHNKITMETGDILYGVSMEKDGVSRIISVKMDKARAVADGQDEPQ